MAVKDMHGMFLHELGDVYDAEHRVMEDRQHRVESTSNATLKSSLKESTESSQKRIQNIEQAFEKLDQEPQRQTCDVSQGLVSEAQRGIEEAENSAVRDCLINAAIIKEELYKVAAYRNLSASVRFLERDEGVPLEGRDEVAELLEENLRGAEESAQGAEERIGDLLDVAKKAGAFQKVRKVQEGEQESKGIMGKAKDKLSGQ